MCDLASKQSAGSWDYVQLPRCLERAAEALEIDAIPHDNALRKRESLRELRAVELRVREPKGCDSGEGRIALPDSPRFGTPKRESQPVIPRVEGHRNLALGQPNRQSRGADAHGKRERPIHAQRLDRFE